MQARIICGRLFFARRLLLGNDMCSFSRLFFFFFLFFFLVFFFRCESVAFYVSFFWLWVILISLQDLVGKKAVVIVRGNPDDHNPNPIQDFINQHQIEVQAEWFYDWRSGDTDWAFRRYEDRLGFSKGVERGVDCIIVEPNFFFSIGQVSSFEQKLIIRMMDNFNCPLVSIAGSFESVSFHHTAANDDDLLDAVVSYEKLRNQLSKLRRKT